LDFGWTEDLGAARDGTVLVDDPGASFEAILAAPNRQAIWLATRDGELREIAISTGRTLATLRVDDQISAAADSADGQVAALSGAHRVWIVPLSGGTVRSVALPNCSLGRAAFRSDALFYLPCLGSTLLTVSVPAAKVIGHFNVSTSGAYAARVMPRSGTLLVGDGSGAVFALTGSTETLLQTSGCGGEILRIAVAPDEIAIAPVGLGAGYISCTTRAIATGPGASSDPSHWEWDHVAESESHSLLAEASAFDLSGDAFAYGYSDGTIVLHPTANIDPTLTFTVAGAIRDMFVSTGDDLLVATANGIVQAIPLCNGCLSDRALARVAVARLQRAIALGILHKPPSTAAASRER
jgi:sarcosine oxidase gamma subunit